MTDIKGESNDIAYMYNDVSYRCYVSFKIVHLYLLKSYVNRNFRFENSDPDFCTKNIHKSMSDIFDSMQYDGTMTWKYEKMTVSNTVKSADLDQRDVKWEEIDIMIQHNLQSY